MLGKQWLNRYTRHLGGSIDERCEDRQRKLDGLERYRFRIVIEIPPVLLQLSLLLLTFGLALFLWPLKRQVAWVVIGFILFGALSYTTILIIGTLSYDCPFQTPPSLVLRHVGVFGPTKKHGSADCIFWSLDHITDPRVTIVALRHLISIKWHDISSRKVPSLQVARIYVKCLNAGRHFIEEQRDMAHAAGRALVHLYLHRKCSGENLGEGDSVVANALNHLFDKQHDITFEPLSLILNSIRNPNSPEYRWEMAGFDLPWVSELWMYHMWLYRTQLTGHRTGGIVMDRSTLNAIRMLFEIEKSPPPVVARNLLYGLLAGASSTILPLDKLIGLQRYVSLNNCLSSAG